MSRWHGSMALALAIALIAGCVRPAPRSNPRLAIPSATSTSTSSVQSTGTVRTTDPVTKAEGPIVTSTAEGGVISGRLRWEGPADTSNGTGPNPRLCVDAESQGIADAVIWLVKPPSAGVAAPGANLLVTQRDGTFKPHLQTALRGTRLKLLTTDDRASFRAMGAADFSVNPRPAKPEERPLDRVGLVELRSDLDPALSAYVWLFDHPYFAKTDAKGTFRLADRPLPPGKYELVLWHEGWRPGSTAIEKKATVDVSSDKGVSIDWTLSGRDADKK